MVSIGTLLNFAFVFGAVLSLGALSGYFAERVGIVNIGINGMMIMGALLFCVYSSFIQPSMGNGSYLLPAVLSALTCSIFGLLFGFAVIVLKANHIIAGTAINLLGSGLGLFLTSPLGNDLMNLPNLQNPYNPEIIVNQSIFGLYGESIILLVIAIVIIAIVFIIMHYTAFGLRYRSIGENPNAADSQGINVFKYQWIALILSSIVGGLAGSFFIMSIGGNVFYGNVSGMGYISLAMMIVGSWRLIFLTIASIAFSFLYGFSKATSLGTDLQLIMMMVPYIIAVVVMVFFSKWSQMPEHDGVNFDKSKR